MRRTPALLIAGAITASAVPAEPRQSGYAFMTRATQALQDDDTQNPAMLWVAEGQRLWGDGARSCSGCHGPLPTSMRGVASRHPAWDEATRRPITLSQRINQCRARHQQLPAWSAESEPLLAIEAAIGLASRGLPIAPPDDPRLSADRTLGEKLFAQRFGQLDLSCTMCHDRLAGKRLAGSVIPQAHPTGYPIYRLEWQGMGSLQRRLRGCMTGIRAEPWGPDAREWVALELHLAQRAAGMKLETPAVRP